MKKTKYILTLLLVAVSAWGLSVDFDKSINVTPANAKGHGITFDYHAPIPALITVTMPYQKDKASFEHAELEVSSGEQHFKIPVSGKKNEEEQLFIAFWMDRKTLRQATLRIRFEEEGELEGTVFWLKCKDFVSEKKETHNK